MGSRRRKTIKKDTFPIITLGQVVDTNDPKQMGRVRILCTALGDTENMQLANLPWANYVSPLAGVTSRGSRGREDDTTFGPVAYGMWNIPKVGALALVACLDGDPRIRVYFGQMHGELLTHTLPHGRFSVRGTIGDFSDETLADLAEDESRPVGPFNSREEVIQPQYDKLIETFTAPPTNALNLDLTKTKPQRNYEYFSRGADNQVSRLSESDVFETDIMSFARDDLDDPFHIMVPGDAEDSTQGYQHSRIQPNTTTAEGNKVYDSQIYSWTTPGLHAIAMDDAPDNCRMRFRTTHGHQIILDDTNERIYISTAGGKTWVEMDEKGNIDYYAERNISFHAGEDFNITAKNIRMKADESIHMIAEGEMRLHSVGPMHVKTYDEFKLQSIGNLHIDTQAQIKITANDRIDIKSIDSTLYVDTGINVDIHAAADVIIEAVADVHITAGGAGYLTTGSTLDIDATGDAFMTTAGNLHLSATSAAHLSATGDLHMIGANANMQATSGGANVLAAASVLLTGATVHLNGPPASPGTVATNAVPADASSGLIEEALFASESWWTNRVPEHEPWPRVMTDPTKTDTDGDIDNQDPSLANTHLDAAEYPYVDENVGKMERGFDMARNKNWKR